MSLASMAVRGALLAAAVAGTLIALGLSYQKADAAGPIDVNGTWNARFDTFPALCIGTGSIIQTGSAVSLSVGCYVATPMLPIHLNIYGTGTIDQGTGAFATSNADPHIKVTGTASKDGTLITGEWTSGGQGPFAFKMDRAPPTPTPTPCPSGKVPAVVGCGTPTATPVPLEFSIGIDADSDTADDCDTRDGPTKCAVTNGSTFWLRFYLDDRGGFIYQAYDFIVAYAGVTPTLTIDFSPWPDCLSTASGMLTPSGPLGAGCFANDPSTYTGLMTRVQFVCAASGSVAMVHGPGGTELHPFGGGSPRFEAAGGSETLGVNCVAPPTPADVGGVSGDPPFGDGRAGTGAGPGGLVAMVVAVAAGAFALGGAARYARRRARR